MRLFLLFMLLCFDVKAITADEAKLAGLNAVINPAPVVDPYVPRFNIENNVFTIPRVIIYDSKGNERLLYDVVGTFSQLPSDLVWKDAFCGFSPAHPVCTGSGVYYKSTK